MKTRRKFTSEFKTKVVIEALKERLPLSELAEKYEVHPNQINQWKKQFLENAGSVFEKPGQKDKGDSGKEQERLYRKIGQLQIEVDFLKKALE